MKGFGIFTTILIGGSLVFFALFCIGMGIFAFLMTFFQYAKPELDAQKNFDPALCLVTGHNGINLDCNRQGSSQHCYQYATSVNVNVTTESGGFWMASANKRHKYRFGSVEGARAWLNEHPVGETYKCYYDPKDRQSVVFSRKVSSQNVIAPLVLSGIFCLTTTFCGPFVVIVLVISMTTGFFDVSMDDDDGCLSKITKIFKRDESKSNSLSNGFSFNI